MYAFLSNNLLFFLFVVFFFALVRSFVFYLLAFVCVRVCDSFCLLFAAASAAVAAACLLPVSLALRYVVFKLQAI